MNCDIKDENLAPGGKKRIEWASNDMPVLAQVKERFEKEKPLKGMKMSACLHVRAQGTDSTNHREHGRNNYRGNTVKGYGKRRVIKDPRCCGK